MSTQTSPARPAPMRSRARSRVANGLLSLTVVAACLTLGGCPGSSLLNPDLMQPKVDPNSANAPADPNDPNAPADPNDPNAPGDPNAPADPNDPNAPGDPNAPADPNDPNALTCTVQFVNTSPYDATVVYYIGTADQRFEQQLVRDGTRRRTAVVPAGQKLVVDPVACAEIQSIMISEARFDLGAGLSAAGATGVFLQGEDYACQDTLRFLIDYRIHTQQLTLALTVPPDCNKNHIPDDEDIANGTSADANNNGVPDECEQQ